MLFGNKMELSTVTYYKGIYLENMRPSEGTQSKRPHCI